MNEQPTLVCTSNVSAQLSFLSISIFLANNNTKANIPRGKYAQRTYYTQPSRTKEQLPDHHARKSNYLTITYRRAILKRLHCKLGSFISEINPANPIFGMSHAALSSQPEANYDLKVSLFAMRPPSAHLMRAIANRISNENEYQLLKYIWMAAPTTATAVVCIDTEFENFDIIELGVAIQATNSLAFRHHVIVQSSLDKHKKRKTPKPFIFGSSQIVGQHAELVYILGNIFADLASRHDVIVLAGHDVVSDLGRLNMACGWQVPENAAVLDTLRI